MTYGIIVAGVLLVASGTVQAAEPPIDRASEIAMARSAGPEAVSASASVWVLGDREYELAEKGGNEFNCLVMRRWGAAFDSQKTIFETPGGVIAPICYDAKASVAPMREQMLRAKLGLAGKTHDEIRDAVFAAYESGELDAIDGVAFAYMYSAAQRLGPGVGAWHPHVMVYAPGYTNEMIGGASVSSGDPVVAEAPGTARAIIAIPVNGRAEHIHPAMH
ncbi:hypothetical protein [Hyphococcus sp.]|uniref:hypothetical protein n=1 Tax=Hyphococcus sp. TaxID=2038636 RepID=UPI00208D00B7|nr:MAG: hypothetical protein DHS20C04_29960 [Marinicaulis sp.]